MSHNIEDKGFSIDQAAPACAASLHSCSVMSKNLVPRFTAFISFVGIPGMPFKNCSERIGGGPPSFRRALENVVHGVPKCTRRTAPELIQASSLLRSRGSRMSAGASTSPSTTMSIGGRTAQPRWRMARLSQALPEKTSTNQRNSKCSAVGWSGTSDQVL